MIFRSKQHIGKLGSYRRKRKSSPFWMRALKFMILAGAAGSILGGLIVGITLFIISTGTPDVDSINTYIPAETTKIYSSDGVVLAELHQEENRILIPLERISPTLRQTVVALEDTNFWNHHGIDFRGMLRALYKDILARSFVEGGSTLTQQLARNLFLHKQKKIVRKLSEIVLALEIERKFTKEEILEMYLNQVYWGHNSYGIESASQLYFGKNAKDLTLAESAGLVGLLKGPELFSPFRNMVRYKARQKTVLERMKRLDLIDQKTLDDAYSEPTVLATKKKHRYKAPFFTSFVVEKLIETYGEEATYTSGMKVYTTLNYSLQEKAKEIINEYMDYGNKPYWIKGEKVPSLNYNQGALMAVEPDTGYIRVLQGGKSFTSNEFNRCTQAHRQPGSSFKPFVYLTALAEGFSPGTIIEDAPVTFNTIEGPYQPLNYSLKHFGRLPLKRALEKSVNVIAVKLNHLVGPEKVVKMAQRLGIQSPLKPVLSLPLGANEVTMLELVSSYMVLANQGKAVKPVSILKIEDRNGIPLFRHKLKERRVIDGNLVAALVDMMTGVLDYGTGRGAKIPRPAAGKTGTTSNYKDAWFVGFVPQLVCATWVGNDDNVPMRNVTGGWVPARMWREFMKHALKNVPTKAFPRPKNMVERDVDWETGLLSSSYTPESATVTRLKYWRGSEPTQYDTQDSIKAVKEQSLKEEKDDNLIMDYFDIN